MGHGVKSRVEFATNLGLNGKGIQNLIHNAEHLSVAGEEEPVKSNLLVNHNS